MSALVDGSAYGEDLNRNPVPGEPAYATNRCSHCDRPIYWSDYHKAWNLVYREYPDTQYCDALSDGAVLSRQPHEKAGK